MAGEWMKVEKTTPEKAEIDRIAEQLSIDPHEALGKCFIVWRWFDDHTENGVADGVKPSKIDRLTGLHGFADAMVSVGWLTVLEDGLSLPNFDRHCGETAKKRALTRNRVEKHRKNCNAPSVTRSAHAVTHEALPEENRREENRKESPTGDACAVDAAAMQRVVGAWNELAFRECRKLNDDRTAALTARLSDPDWAANWAQALVRIRDSTFCRGKGNRGWIATFDWFVRPNTVTKILEGQYDNSATQRDSRIGPGQLHAADSESDGGAAF